MDKDEKFKELELQIKTIIEIVLRKASITYEGINIIIHPLKTVGVQGDERTYSYPTEVEIISSEKRRIYEECLEKISTRTTNEIKVINRILYTIKTKS